MDFVVERLGLDPGARVLDIACGHGRHSLEFARRGFRVTGVDLSPRSLELAREAARGESLDVEFVERDLLKGRNEATWTFIREDGSRSELSNSLRVYTPHELARMFDAAGPTVVDSWGGFDSQELGFDTWRLILRGDTP